MPKRKVKKPVEFWVGFRKDGSVYDCTFSRDTAKHYGDMGYIVRHYTDEIEVDEE